jgi:transposase
VAVEQPRRPIAHVARELGAHPEAMRTWIRQDEPAAGERTDRPTTAEQEELRRLRKENLELRRANETSHADDHQLHHEMRLDSHKVEALCCWPEYAWPPAAMRMLALLVCLVCFEREQVTIRV